MVEIEENGCVEPGYRESDQEKSRTADLVRLLPRGRRSVLDIGARDGYFSQLLTEYFDEVTALDLEKPDFSFQRVTTLAGAGIAERISSIQSTITKPRANWIHVVFRKNENT
jgi:protein-L-isoaspartate O-methyltransferase